MVTPNQAEAEAEDDGNSLLAATSSQEVTLASLKMLQMLMEHNA